MFPLFYCPIVSLVLVLVFFVSSRVHTYLPLLSIDTLLQLRLSAMGAGAVLEPLVVIVLLFGGTWINRATDAAFSRRVSRRSSIDYTRSSSPDSLESGYTTPTPKDSLLNSHSHSSPSPSPTLTPRQATPPPQSDDRWHKRVIGIFNLSCSVTSPNTAVFQDRLLSRLLRKLPFLAECWYWALVYWVCPSARKRIIFDSFL